MTLFDQFVSFAKSLTIESKEQGLIPLNMYQGQVFAIKELFKGIEEEKRIQFYLKNRQGGYTTIFLAFDLFWAFKVSGLQASLISDTDDNRDYFKSVLTNYYASLPKSKKIPKTAHNIHRFSFANRSRLSYLVAGEREKGTLGKGKGINFVHATEVASWGAGTDLDSLTSALAEQYPWRVFIFESTAFGFNDFHDLYYSGKNSMSSKSVFLGWWLSPEIYSVQKGDPRFNVYGRQEPQGEERTWINEVRDRHSHEITPEQLAWWRWHLYEKKRGNLAAMYQEFPPTEDYAFQMSGSKFFGVTHLTDAKKLAMCYPYEAYSYSFGLKFEDMQLIAASPRMCMLKIWEKPNPRGWYVIGADPAYGSSDNADRFCVEVYRAYSDRLIQVAEFNTPELSTSTFAWVISHICGYYKNVLLNLEIQGGGDAVLNELQHMREYHYYDHSISNDVLAVMAQISWYVFRRIDSMSGGFALHWKTTQDTKNRMMDYFRDGVELKQIVIRSEELLEEMRYISREGITIETAGKKKDDRVMASGLAVIPWKEGLQMRLSSEGISYRPDEEEKTEEQENNEFLGGVLKSMGIPGFTGR